VNLNVFCMICCCDLGIAHGFHVDIKKAKFSAAEISAANIHKNLLKLQEKLTGPCNFEKNMWEPRNMSLPLRLTISDPHDDA